jgi:hypothetical protein
MPTPETALIDTLKALYRATTAVAAVASSGSETARVMFAGEADASLARVGEAIERLAKTAADHPTLFGKNVGDGLDAERTDASTAVNLLRLLLVGTDGQPPLLQLLSVPPDRSNPALATQPGHVRLPLAQNEMALVEALLKGE